MSSASYLMQAESAVETASRVSRAVSFVPSSFRAEFAPLRPSGEARHHTTNTASASGAPLSAPWVRGC